MNPDHGALARGPIFFERNRVFRVYEGGKLFADFFGDEPVDGNLPEEWIASSVKALNRDSTDPDEGLSAIRGTDLKFAELLHREPEAMLGAGGNFNVLVKILDSAIRLPIQAHPDKEFSRAHFNSDYGKTEMWLVLATRPGARIYFGFDRRITKAQFSAAVEAGADDKEAMTGLLNEVKVEPGDVYLIPAKSVHAIGYGCLILEVQEPTDFTIQPEYWCGNYRLNDYEMYLGLPKDIALECFDFSVVGAAGVALAKKSPRIKESDSTTTLETLIDPQDTPCFSVERLTLKGSSRAIDEAPCICIAVQGEGIITGPSGAVAIKKATTSSCRIQQRGSTALPAKASCRSCTATRRMWISDDPCNPLDRLPRGGQDEPRDRRGPLHIALDERSIAYRFHLIALLEKQVRFQQIN